ncbi:MAG TPA: YihY/virulence factor BrkB family protein [Polyangiaceae bacterium]|nr:YihY/virulence factor BrkB family protein [Polyangiaceae bacterium]
MDRTRRSTLHELVNLLWQAGARWAADRCDRLAAALSCYALFSLFPLAMLSLTTLGYVLGDDPRTRARIVSSFAVTGSPELRSLISQTLASMQQHRTARGVGTVVGVVSLLFGASGVFAELRNAFSLIWRVSAPPSSGVRQTILEIVRGKALALALVGLAGLVLLASLVAGTVWAAIDRPGSSTTGDAIFQVAEPLASALFLAPILAVVLRVILGRRIAWRDLAFASSLTALLLCILKKALAFYLARVASYAAYGVAGALLGFLTWVYASAMLLFFGMQLTRVRAERRAVAGPDRER